MGGASVVGYLIGDPNSLRNSIYDFSIGSKQPYSTIALSSSTQVIAQDRGIPLHLVHAKFSIPILRWQTVMFRVSNINSLLCKVRVHYATTVKKQFMFDILISSVTLLCIELRVVSSIKYQVSNVTTCNSIHILKKTRWRTTRQTVQNMVL